VVYYFAYGSNMDKDDLDKWCEKKGYPRVDFLRVNSAKINGWELKFNYKSPSRNCGTANIMESSNSYVCGLLIKIDEKSLETIRKKEGCCDSKKEGLPNYYNEITIDTVEKFNGDIIDNIKTYKVVKEREKNKHQPPNKKYMQLIIRNAKRYGFPKEYRKFLKSFETKDC